MASWLALSGFPPPNVAKSMVTAKVKETSISFPLLKTYDPAEFAAVTKELDSLATRLAHSVGAKRATGQTTNVAGRKVRSYRYGDRRLGFVLEGKREYQLFCRPVSAACDLLYASFTLSGPQAS